MQNFEEERSDGLEIISIGTLYKGSSWDKKYWSSSRGKDRYPYPIGYHAVRTHNGTAYKMEICEGLKGPLFAITSTDGDSCSGQTPDITWESFQKKSSPRAKLGQGKRFTCKIDGVEFFGFRNALVQRLLRDLVSNVDGTAERNLSSTGFCNEAHRVEPDTQSSDSCKRLDLLPNLINSQNIRKRSRKAKIATIDTATGPELSRLQEQDVSDSLQYSITEKDNQKHHNGERGFTVLNEDCKRENSPKSFSAAVENELLERGNNSVLVKDDSASDSWRIANPLKMDADLLPEHQFDGCGDSIIDLSKQEEHVRMFDTSMDTYTQGCDSLEATKDAIGERMREESKTVKNLDLYVPDSLDVLQGFFLADKLSDFASNCKKEDLCQVIEDELAASVLIHSGESVRSLHGEDEVGIYISNGSSQKSCDDSVGGELAKSMMTLLLPQALPLLKKRSGRKRSKVHISEFSLCNGDSCLNLDAMKLSEGDGLYHAANISPGTLEVGTIVNGSSNTMEGQTHCINKIHVDIQNLESAKSIVPDSFEDEQFGSHASNQRSFCPDSNEVDDKDPGPTKDISSLEPTFIPLNETEPAQSKSTTNYLISNSSLADELPSKKFACSLDMVASTSEPDNIKEVCTPNSTKNMGNMSNGSSNDKPIQYSRRRRSTTKKDQNSSSHGNQDSIVTKQMSATREAVDVNSKVCQSLVHMSEKEVDIIETRYTKNSNISSLQKSGLPPSKRFRGPLSESIIYRNNTDSCLPDVDNLFATECDHVGASVASLHKKVPIGGEVRFDRKSNNRTMEIGTDRLTGMLSQVQAVADHSAKIKDTIDGKKHQDGVITSGTGSSLLFQEIKKCFSFDDHLHDTKENFDELNMHPQFKSVTSSSQNNGHLFFDHELHEERLLANHQFSLNTEDSYASKDFVELVGCYVQPAPILSVVLSPQGDDVHITVLCGILADRLRNIFVYKVPLEDPSRGCPSFLGYTSLMLPISKYTFSGEIAFEKFPVQFTPDGQGLVISNSIKAPYCRERSIHCVCSVCTSACSEENAVKIIHVKLGYVSLVAKLKTEDNVHSILVCEPSHLVALEKNGRVIVWSMNSMWNEKVEEFILPSLTYTSPCTLELRKIPKHPSLIVGHNGFGDFGLWDIAKRTILSTFSAPRNCIFQFLPVGLLVRKKPDSAGTYVEEQIKGIMSATERLFSGTSVDVDFLSFDDEDIAVWLLVSAVWDSEVQFDHKANGINMSANGSWRLALLVDNRVIMGKPLDPRASVINALEGCGIIGSHDGLVYIWELSTGLKLADLHHFNSGRVSCISSDSKSGVLAVAGDENQLLIYAMPQPMRNS
ncbi:Dna binding protein [Thalictrum thalictroides]|uniref:Dna binding protein n=1 Tax=Thalictrum thalictroides TaxID=46969 RepID=A0A7J6X842_THATH|nr:Dna binding protein [Thalictrum thalictroides]